MTPHSRFGSLGAVALFRSAGAVALFFSLIASSAQAQTPNAGARPPQGVRFVYLVRHGIYDRDTTVTNDALGNGLNALGHEQATLVGARLKQLPVRLSRLMTSDYLRARETAHHIGGAIGMTVMVDTLLHECTPSSDRPDYRRDVTDAEVALCDSNLAAAFAKYFRPSPDADTRDVLVCHGNVIRWLVARALGMDVRTWTHLDLANCSLTVIAVRPDGGMRLAAFSDTGHLPVEKQTWGGRGAGWAAARR